MAKLSSKLKRTLQGRVFCPADTKATFMSLKAWVDAGKPDNASIFDNADTLLVCGVPICDGILVRGMYVRCPVRKAQPAELTLIRHMLKDLRVPDVKSKGPGIAVAEPKDHHKMVY